MVLASSLSRLLRGAGAAAFATAALAAGAQPASPPQHAAQRFSSAPIPGRYIVVFRDGVADPAAEAASLARSERGQLHFTYTRALKGFTATLPDAAVARLRNHPNVAFVEQDQAVSLQQGLQQEAQATWGLDRIDQVDLPLDTVYSYGATGLNVTAFIIDTGIRADHVEFTGACWRLHGHQRRQRHQRLQRPRHPRVRHRRRNHLGRRQAGGAGPGARAGLPRLGQLQRRHRRRGLGGGQPAAAGGGQHVAGRRLVLLGQRSGRGRGGERRHHGGGGRQQQRGRLPVLAGQRALGADVGATTSTDARASYSNFGNCLDLFAPGSSITSAWNTSPTATNTISGTSMASPHVTGAAALVLQSNPGASPAAVGSFLTSHATANHVSSPGTGSPNLLLFSLAAGAVSEPAKPTVAISGITGAASRSGRNWKATATVTIKDVNTHQPVANVTDRRQLRARGSGSCTTGGNGSCTIASGVLAPNVAATQFTVTAPAATSSMTRTATGAR
jgi:subtilisin family serine protease